jgi:hypothetical protein
MDKRRTAVKTALGAGNTARHHGTTKRATLASPDKKGKED